MEDAEHSANLYGANASETLSMTCGSLRARRALGVELVGLTVPGASAVNRGMDPFDLPAIYSLREVTLSGLDTG